MFEIALAILVGPVILNWVKSTDLIETLSQFGLAVLFFMAAGILAGGSIQWTSKGRPRHGHRLSAATPHSSGQFGVRLVLLIVSGAVALSTVFGLDMLLGAFARGILWRVCISGVDKKHAKVVETTLDAIAHGSPSPLFFINTDLAFDLDAALDSGFAIALMPLLVLVLLVVRGLPSVVAAPAGAGPAERWALVLFSATGLAIIVAVSAIGRSGGYHPSGIATALIGAGSAAAGPDPNGAQDQGRVRRRMYNTIR